MSEAVVEVVEEDEWTEEQVTARANDPMPDVPVVEGLTALSVEPATLELMAAAAQPGTRAAMLHVAQGLSGLHEQPMGSNHAPPVTTEYGAGNVPWCDEAVTYEGVHSGNHAAIGRFAFCPAHTRFFAHRGQWAYGASDLQAGDVVFYRWDGRHSLDAEHVGLVAHVYSNGTFDAWEGNHNDRFGLVRRDHTYVAGRGRPHYPNGAGSTPTPPSGGGGSKPKWSGRYLRYAHGHDLMRGQDVTWTQRLLAHHGHHVADDGVYGRVTAGAVEAFQREHGGLSIDGVVGPNTWAAL
jgi:hypothetical protein